jgi:cytidylate kinase
MKIIGIAGTNGSGKDIIALMLRDQHGWFFAGATEMLGVELDKRGLTHERVNKSALSAEWRRQYGMAAVVDKGLELYEAEGADKNGLVISSLRHPGEADKVHELGGLVLWLDADPAVRYARIQANDRGRVEDKKTFEQFLAEQEAEMHPVGDDATLNIAGVKDRADIFIENNGDDIEQFKLQTIETLKQHGLI